MSVNQLGLYCTFAPRRSHPQRLHYAPTTGLDPSPLQDFFLLSRSLLVSDAPGSRTFMPCPDCGGHFFELREKSWISELKHFGKQQKIQPKALRSSRAPQENRAFTELSQSFEEWIALCDVLTDFFKAQLMIINIFPHWLQALSKRKSPASVRAQMITCWLGSTLQAVQSESVSGYSLNVCVQKVFLCHEARSDQNSRSEGQKACSEPLSWSMNETLCRDRAWRRGLSTKWGTDCWNGCSHWCKVHPLFGLLPDSASNQWLSSANFSHTRFVHASHRVKTTFYTFFTSLHVFKKRNILLRCNRNEMSSFCVPRAAGGTSWYPYY